ncbi:uncharacterized protein [Polyergus mexicanus]|uniref:uncharacterized protein n=1 Tax=Polyergus mexicanus TaxID=615972 RepID=UPI0038B51E6C
MERTSSTSLPIKIPPFWNDEPELWFAQLEGQFILSGITQETTEYSYVLSQLDSRQIREVKDIIIHPPEANNCRQCTGFAIAHLMVRGVPRQTQMILATRTEDCLNDVAEQADRIHEMTSRTVVAATTAPRETLEAQIQALSKKVATLMTHLSRGRLRDKKHDRKGSRTRSQSRDYDKRNCFYHNRFRDKAQKCTPPCAFQSEKDQGSH